MVHEPHHVVALNAAVLSFCTVAMVSCIHMCPDMPCTVAMRPACIAQLVHAGGYLSCADRCAEPGMDAAAVPAAEEQGAPAQPISRPEYPAQEQASHASGMHEASNRHSISCKRSCRKAIACLEAAAAMHSAVAVYLVELSLIAVEL